MCSVAVVPYREENFLVWKTISGERKKLIESEQKSEERALHNETINKGRCKNRMKSERAGQNV